MPKVQRRLISNALKRSITLGLFSFGFRSPSLEVGRDFGELGEGGLEVFDDFGGDDIGVGKIRCLRFSRSPITGDLRLASEI